MFTWRIEDIFWFFLAGVWALSMLLLVVIKTADTVAWLYGRAKERYQEWWLKRNVPELWPLYEAAKKERDKARR